MLVGKAYESGSRSHMVLILDGNSEHVAHSYGSFREKISDL